MEVQGDYYFLLHHCLQFARCSILHTMNFSTAPVSLRANTDQVLIWTKRIIFSQVHLPTVYTHVEGLQNTRIIPGAITF